MIVYSVDELIEKIKKLDTQIEDATSQVSFGGRSLQYQVSEWSKQRDRYQAMLDRKLAQTGQGVKTHRIKRVNLL